MKHYIDITLLPDPEIPLYFLWEKVYQQLHLALVEHAFEKEVVDNSGNKKLIKVSKIGISFPGYDVEKHHLCKKLRLFSETKELLESLNAGKWLANLSDYVHLTSIKPVEPEKIKGYGCFYRIQAQHNNAYLARRKTKAKKNALPFEEAMKYFALRKDKSIDAPFVYLKSASSGKRFPLFIAYQEKKEANYQGFSCYGLSPQSTVPIF
jgi:CRISPR-associated endonuclease Csy4